MMAYRIASVVILMLLLVLNVMLNVQNAHLLTSAQALRAQAKLYADQAQQLNDDTMRRVREWEQDIERRAESEQLANNWAIVRARSNALCP